MVTPRASPSTGGFDATMCHRARPGFAAGRPAPAPYVNAFRAASRTRASALSARANPRASVPLGTLSAAGLTVCRLAEVVALLEVQKISDAAVDSALLAARVDSSAKKPSVEAMFHAWLLIALGKLILWKACH